MEFEVKFISKILHRNLLPFKISTKATSVPSPLLYLINAKSFQKMFAYYFKSRNVPHPQLKKKKKPPELLCKKSVFKNFALFTGEHLCRSLFLIKLQAFRPVFFPVNIVKYLRKPILKNLCKWLILKKGTLEPNRGK